MDTVGKRQLARDLVSQNRCGGAGFLDTVCGGSHVQGFEDEIAVVDVLQAIEESAQDAKRRGGDAGAHAGVHAFGQDLHRQCAGEVAAQARGEPELLVVAALGIQADHEVRLTQASGQVFDVGGQIDAAGFLGSLDENRTGGVGDALFL